jgi:outer membrane protein insertion porin family
MNNKSTLSFILTLILPYVFAGFAYTADISGEIREIEVEGLTRLKKEELINIIFLNIGDTFSGENLRAGIKRVFRKGIFLDIEVTAEPYDGGLKLKYIVTELPVIKKISIRGNRKISDRKIKKIYLFKKGGNFKEDLLDKARADLKHYYSRKGFPDADIKAIVEKTDEPHVVNLSLQIQEGSALIVDDVDMRYEVKTRISISPGDVLDRERVEKDIKELRSFYKKRGHINPMVGPYTFEDETLSIPVLPGPVLEVFFKGNKIYSSKRLSEEISLKEENEITDDLIRESVDRIAGLYNKKGYYYAEVTGGVEREDNLIRVSFFIYEGQRVVLKEINIENITIPSEAIKSIIPLQENRPFDKGHISSSSESIIRFYNALGYLDAEIEEVRENFSSDGSKLTIVFVVNQGQEVINKELTIIGNKEVGIDEIRMALQVEEGAPYNEFDIGDARYRVLALYNRLGFINAEVEVESIIESGSAAVIFKITENEPFIFGKIVISGNQKTKDNIIRREFTIREGDPYNYEAIFRTRQQLYDLGLFTSINFEPIETSDILKHAEKKTYAHTQDILVDLEEGNPGVVEFSLGYGDYEKLRGSLDISYNNLGGLNRQIGLRTELSSIEERYILNFRDPWLFNKPSLPFKASLTKEKIRSIDIDTKNIKYKMNRLSLVVGVDKEFTGSLKGNLNYEYSIVETTEVQPGVILSREDTGTVGISSISPALFYDTRDDPFNPTSGSINGVILKIASRALFSESEFIKAILRSTSYFKLRKGLIFAFSMKGGIAHGLGDTAELPIIERFFLGGRTTVRGYDHDSLGPKGADESPTGGNVFALFNSEFRISLGKGFGLVTFVDAGNVWTKISEFEPILRYTAGLGLRYDTPVGPFRVDYGHKLNREDGESAGEFHFSFGHAF